MEEYTSATSHPALLDLRGHFHLEPRLAVHDPTWPPDYPMEVFPISDEQAILVRAQSTSLIDLLSGEVRWTIPCPALEAALDMERDILALGAKGRVYLWDLQSGSLIQTFPLGDDEDIATCQETFLSLVSGMLRQGTIYDLFQHIRGVSLVLFLVRADEFLSP